MSGGAIKACTQRRVIFVNGQLPPVRWQALNWTILDLGLYLRVLVQ